MKSILITGAGRGLGRGFVDYCLSQNMLVFAGVRSAQYSLPAHPNLQVLPLDVTRDNEIVAAAQVIEKQVGYLDFLVNNAGVNKRSATNDHKALVDNLAELDRQALLHMFDVNAVAPLLVLKHMLPLLNQSGQSFVINISSERASFHPEFPVTSGNYGYRASKLALNMMTAAAVHDLSGVIKVFAVHPGSVQSDMNKQGTQLPRKQAENILAITRSWTNDLQGKFLNYDGTPYPL